MIDNDYKIRENNKFLRKGIYTTIEGILAVILMVWLFVISDDGNARTLMTIFLVGAIIFLLYGVILLIIGIKRKAPKKSFISDEEEPKNKFINEEEDTDIEQNNSSTDEEDINIEQDNSNNDKEDR